MGEEERRHEHESANPLAFSASTARDDEGKQSVGLISSVANRTEEPTESSEEDDYQREEILEEVFDEDDYDDDYYDDEDEGQGFVMSM